MPIYEYRCTACSHELETIRKFSDAPLLTCPHCGRDALAKKVSAAGFHLKGSGWYQTDFRSNGSQPAAKADAAVNDGKPDGKPADPAATTKADSPAAKSEAPAAKSEPSTVKGATPTRPAAGSSAG